MFRGAVKFRNHFAVSARGSLGNYDHTAALLAGTVDLQVTLHYEFIIVPQISMLLTYKNSEPIWLHARKKIIMASPNGAEWGVDAPVAFGSELPIRLKG